jgi:hypothetical protein
VPGGTTIEILLPVPPSGVASRSAPVGLGRPIAGVTVGLRLDRSWRSYEHVVDVWRTRLTNDGARVEVFVAGDRVGPEGDRTRDDLDEWSRLIEVGVIGLGN